LETANTALQLEILDIVYQFSCATSGVEPWARELRLILIGNREKIELLLGSSDPEVVDFATMIQTTIN
jgi:hypothetical protein